MIEKKTIVDQIEITRSGHIQVRLGLLLVEDGVEIDCKWHRTVIEPGGDVDAQIALVNTHLDQMGKSRLPAAPLSELKSISAIVHTPERVTAFRNRRDAELAKLMLGQKP